MLKRDAAQHAEVPARGMSIVELMVGIAIGLFVLAGATVVVTGQLSENSKLLADARVHEDLRTAADIIARDIRRAGYADLAYKSVWPVDTPAGIQLGLSDIYAAMSPASGPTTTLTYSSSSAGAPAQNGALAAPMASEYSGVRYNAAAQTIEMQLGSGNWQALTDPASVLITGFSLTLSDQVLPVPCAQLCPVGPGGNPVNVYARNVAFTIVGQSASDSSVVRSLTATVRVRNDIVAE